MEHKFEDFIRANRQAMDCESPNSMKMWDVIQKDQKVKRFKFRVNVWKVVAGLALLVTVSFGVLNAPKMSHSKFVLYQIDNQLGNQEKEYAKQVADKEIIIKESNTRDSEIIFCLENELTEIDKVYDQVAQKNGMSGNTEVFVATIFDTYEKRLLILDRIINEIEKQKRNEEPSRKKHA